MSCRCVCLAVVVSAGSAFAEVPVPVGSVTLPGPAANAYSVSTRYAADGRLYVWDGASVLRETMPGAGAFTILSTGGSGSADTAGINFTSDGSTIVVGNGAGGSLGGDHNGLIFTMPITGGAGLKQAADLDYHIDFIPLPSSGITLPNASRMMLVEAGTGVSIVDLGSADNATSGKAVIANIPGASASLVMDSAHRLYVGSGYGAHRGDIRRFNWSDVESAFRNAVPLNWSDGQLFNPTSSNNNSGSGMFFDKRGYLFAGGNGGMAVFAPDGTGEFVSLGADPYYSLTYNPMLDEFFAKGYFSDTAEIYSAAAFVPEPTALMLVATAAMGLLRRRQCLERRAA